MAKIYFIAGESSGDFIGQQLIQNLGKDISFVGVGGPMMEASGMGKTLFPINKINLMGFVEILPHIFMLNKLIKNTINDILNHQPDILITIDSPGFTYRVAKKIRLLLPSLKIIHVVAPSVWAYKPSRALKYAKVYDCLFALLPFEPQYFHRVGLDCRYIGHPILEQKFYHDKSLLKKELQITGTLLCVTAGSREGEILKHLPIFYKTLEIVATKYTDLKVIFVLSNPSHEFLIKQFLLNANFKYSFSMDRLKIFAAADIALAKSGTNTLEIAASRTPMIVAYKLNSLSYWFVKALAKIRFISLINIIPNREILPEFIQFNCTPSILSAALIKLLSDQQNAEQQITQSSEILSQLGFQSKSCPSLIAAQIIKSEFLKERSTS